METKWKYITQDADGTLRFTNEPIVPNTTLYIDYWSRFEGGEPLFILDEYEGIEEKTKPNTNWKKACVNLETHDWRLNEEGHLMAVEKSNRHVHADFMIAFANDTTLKFQWRDREGEWLECTYPSFSNHIEYRIKPEKKKYRVAKLMNGVTLVADNFAEAAGIARDSKFVEWLTDWIEYE